MHLGLKRRIRAVMAWVEQWPYWTGGPRVLLWYTSHGVCVAPVALDPAYQRGQLQCAMGQIQSHRWHAQQMSEISGPRRRKRRQDRRRTDVAGRQGAFSAPPSVLAEAERAMEAAARATKWRGGAHRLEPAAPGRPARLVLNVCGNSRQDENSGI